MEITLPIFSISDPFIVKIVNDCYLNVVGFDDDNYDEIISEVGKQYDAIYGLVNDYHYPTSDVPIYACALKFKSNANMLAFVLKYR